MLTIRIPCLILIALLLKHFLVPSLYAQAPPTPGLPSDVVHALASGVAVSS